MAGSDWTEERTAELVRLWDAGESATAISEQMGLATRNVVIGKIHRLRKAGYPMSRAAQTREQIQENAKAQRAAHEIRRRKLEAAGVKRRKGSSPETCAPFSAAVRTPPTPPVIIDVTFAKPWLERVFGECAYPVAGEGADTMSCCFKTVDGARYCPGHHKVMFRKPEDTGKRFVNAVARLAA